MNESQQTRRTFLKSAMPDDVASMTDEEAESPAVEPGDGARYVGEGAHRPHGSGHNAFIVSVRRRAMACEFELQMAAMRHDQAMEHVFEALDLVEALESQLTVYRPDSEVMRINRTAQTGAVAVEPRLFEILQLAQRLHRETLGALDVTSGPLSDTWGFSRREGRVPTDAEVAEALAKTGMQHVELDEERQTIAFLRQGVRINFNSIGKGHALDRMAELLDSRHVDDYLLHGGKSSVLARGDQPGTAAGSGWTIGVRHPLHPSRQLAEFHLRDEALSTSGSGTQFFIRRGRRYGHILDPRTGRPAEGLYSATVIASSAAEADALSTAFYVMGPKRVGEYCDAHPTIGALLVAPGAREGDVRLFDFGLNDMQWLRSDEG